MQQDLVAVFLICLFQGSGCSLHSTNEGEVNKDQQEEVVEVSEHQSHEANEQHGEQSHQMYDNVCVYNE
jgi:hypothetical protein